jgi:hypothetical protein
MKNIPYSAMALAISAAFVLAACGGSGDDAPASATTPVVTVDPAKETLGQCISSLTLPADLKVTDSTEGDLAVFTWDGKKKRDWSGAEKFIEGWTGGTYKHYFDASTKAVTVDGESVLQTPSEYIVNEDSTNYSEATKYPLTILAMNYSSSDRKKMLGWSEVATEQNGKENYWLKKFVAANRTSEMLIDDLVKDQPKSFEYNRTVSADWFGGALGSESLKSEYRFLGRESIATKFGTLVACVSQEKTNASYKNKAGTGNTIWTEKRWHIPKLGYVKRETLDQDFNDAGKLVLEEKRTYDIVGARKNGKRYGSYDMWTGVLIGQQSKAAPIQTACDYNLAGSTVGFTWLFRPEANGQGVYRVWDGSKIAEIAVNYPGKIVLNNFKSEMFDNGSGVGLMAWAQDLNLDLNTKTLSGTYTRTEKRSKPSVCEGNYPYGVKASKVF